jgi:hypothetical protein
MAAGFSGSSTWEPIDLYGKVVLNVLAVVAFVLLLPRVRGKKVAGEATGETPSGAGGC